MNERQRDKRRHRDVEWQAPEQHEHEVAPVPFGARTPAGVRARQRQAGNRAATAFVQGRPTEL